jgi:hypothetical protein
VKLPVIGLVISCSLPLLGEIASEWQPVSEHGQLQYRVTCRREIATVEWRSGYPGQVTLSASINSEAPGASYDSSENVTVAPGGSAKSPLETMACYPGTYRIRVTHFVMAPPPPPAPAGANPGPTPVATKAAAPIPTVAKYQPPVNDLPDISPEALASVATGMQRDEVVRKLGPPISKLTVPEPGEFIETYQYRVTNGVVRDIEVR